MKSFFFFFERGRHAGERGAYKGEDGQEGSARLEGQLDETAASLEIHYVLVRMAVSVGPPNKINKKREGKRKEE
jgi:hypothetical protein